MLVASLELAAWKSTLLHTALLKPPCCSYCPKTTLLEKKVKKAKQPKKLHSPFQTLPLAGGQHLGNTVSHLSSARHTLATCLGKDPNALTSVCLSQRVSRGQRTSCKASVCEGPLVMQQLSLGLSWKTRGAGTSSATSITSHFVKLFSSFLRSGSFFHIRLVFQNFTTVKIL